MEKMVKLTGFQASYIQIGEILHGWLWQDWGLGMAYDMSLMSLSSIVTCQFF